jgi:hypothetical protein
MSRDLTFLEDPATTAGQAIESTDPRLVALSDLLETRRWKEGGDRAEELLREGVFDIRVLTAYLAASFFEGAFETLEGLFDVVDRLLANRLEAIGPAKKRDEQIDRRLSWLFETITDSIVYHQSKATPEWDAWTAAAPVPTLEGAHAAAVRLGKRLADSPWPTASRATTRIAGWLASRIDELTRAPRRKEEAVVAAAKHEGEGASASPSVDARTPEDDDPLAPKTVRVELGVSVRFLELTAKLKAFEKLVETGQLEKAALVSDDILSMIDSFDPRAYFPEVFGRFSGLVSKNVDTLSSHWEHRDSPKWKAMLQFYRVDLRGFVER